MKHIAYSSILIAFVVLGATVSASAQLPPKQAGVVRIGIVQPQLRMGSDGSPDVADSVRRILAEYLQGPTIEVALLGARLASQYAIEAAQAECDFVLTLSVTHERGRMNDMLGKALDTLAARAPVSSGDATSAILTGVVYSAADFAASTKAKDQLQLDYRLAVVGAAQPVLEDTEKRRAKSDGEDLLTPLVEAAAEAVGAAVTTQAAASR
jgi:hypothetical protein